MRNRRVGTISMGGLLIVLGSLLIYAQLNSKASFDLMIKWWPVIFFLLGAEILIYTSLAKEEHPKVKYDIFSIFIVFVLVFTGIGIYGLTETGVLQRVNMMITAQDYVLEMPMEKMEVAGSVSKLVVNTPLQSGLIIRTGSDKDISAFGTAYVTADTKDTAEEMISEKRMTTQQIGDTLYVSFNQPISGNDFNYSSRIREYTLIIPDSIEVEITGDNHLELMIDNLAANWLIDTNSSVEIRVDSEADLAIHSVVRYADHLRGNVDWITNEKEQNADGQNYEYREEGIEGEIIFGEGKKTLKIISDSAVTVNNI